MPEGFLHILAFIIFSIYGIVTVNQGLGMMPGAQSERALPVTIGIAVIFAVLCIIRLIRQRERK
jgi:Mg2+ and Co2+ transporter CorA